MRWDWLDEEQSGSVQCALRAVIDGPFAPLPRRDLLADEAVVREVRAAWPAAAADPDDTIHVVSQALTAVTGQHSNWWAWPRFFTTKPLPVRTFSDIWCSRMDDGPHSSNWVTGADLTADEAAAITRTAEQIARRDLAGLARASAGDPEPLERYFEAADDWGYGLGSVVAPAGHPRTWPHCAF